MKSRDEKVYEKLLEIFNRTNAPVSPKLLGIELGYTYSKATHVCPKILKHWVDEGLIIQTDCGRYLPTNNR